MLLNLSGRKLSAHYDLILRMENAEANLAPDAIIHLGPLPTSKSLRNWLDKSACARLDCPRRVGQCRCASSTGKLLADGPGALAEEI